MRHLTIASFGAFLGISGERLVVRNSEGEKWDTPLSRLRSIRVEKKGVSLSSDLILACATRGIRLYFADWTGKGLIEVGGLYQHAVVAVRQAQFEAVKGGKAFEISREILRAKVRNQRAVLLYFGKYLSKTNLSFAADLRKTSDRLKKFSEAIQNVSYHPEWRASLMGLEGKAAVEYWNALVKAELLPATFLRREGRGSSEITNAALNYGYAILQSYVHNAVDNAGFEPYAGFLHVNRPGKPSLVLDVMEEFRSWVVDRNIISLRKKLAWESEKGLSISVKREISHAIDSTMANKILWKKKYCRLENVLQRQMYTLSGSIFGEHTYRGIIFKW